MQEIKTLSIVMPCYNEERTIEKILAEVEAVDLGKIKKEIVIVDDCSKDDTRKILKGLEKKSNYRIILQEVNQGKGAAVKAGILATTGDVVLIQDADLEYDPEDYKLLLRPFVRNDADVVYGSRFIGGQPHRLIYYQNKLANKFLTGLSNMFTGLRITDMETCYKAVRGDIARDIAKDLTAQRFNFEPEYTTHIGKRGLRVYEVGISYYGRSKSEGKKIGFKDGLEAVWGIVRFGLTVPGKNKNKK